MALKHNTLASLFTDIADEIRNKDATGTLGQIVADDFPDKIAEIQTGTDTSDATLNSASQMLNGVTAYSKGTKYTGNIATKTATDVTVSADTVTTPAGYYASSVSKSVAAGSAGTPTASKNVSVGTHSATVTPSVVNETGYITGGTKNGNAVMVEASELVSGTYDIPLSAEGNINITNYQNVSVASIIAALDAI